MTLKRKLVMTAAALALMSGVAFASTVTDAIVSDLTAGGYTKIEVKVGSSQIKVEATQPGIKVERVYSAEGALLKEEIVQDGIQTERTFDADGNVVSEETKAVDGNDDDHSSADNDDEDDDQGDDDDSDDDDDNDDDDGDDDEDHDGGDHDGGGDDD